MQLLELPRSKPTHPLSSFLPKSDPVSRQALGIDTGRVQRLSSPPGCVTAPSPLARTLAPASTPLSSVSVILPAPERRVNGVTQGVTFGTGFVLSASFPGEEARLWRVSTAPGLVRLDCSLLNRSPLKVIWVASRFLSETKEAARLCSERRVNIRLRFSGRNAQGYSWGFEAVACSRETARLFPRGAATFHVLAGGARVIGCPLVLSSVCVCDYFNHSNRRAPVISLWL